MTAATVAFVGALVYDIRQLKALLQEHLDDQEGQVLPHLFVADLERWIEAECINRLSESRSLIVTILDFLEEAARRDDEVAELIHASFLEHVPRPGQPGSELRDMVGPNLAQRLRQIG